MPGPRTRLLALGLAVCFTAGGCSLLDADPTSVTLGELVTGAYDPERVTRFDVGTMGLELGDTAVFCDAIGAAPLRWTTDAPVPMQVWVDTFVAVEDVPAAAQASVEQLIDFTQRRLRWSLTGQGDRPVWDSSTVEAAEALLDVAITTCPDLPLVVGFPGQSDRPPGWADMSAAEVADHCASMAQRFEAGIAEFESDYGRPPRHQLEMDLPIAYYGTTDFHGLRVDADDRLTVVPVPDGACDLGESDPLTVMTRNLYLGVDLLPLVSSANIGELAQNAAAAFATVEATDFPARAEALADEIAEHAPALIGLQEVALWRTSEEGVMDGPLSPAEVVVIDFLDVLSGALAARGLEYTVAVVQETFDAEVPSGLDLDVRLTMRNAILADAGAVEITGASDGLFAENSSFETLFGALVDTRGWTAVDALVAGQPLRLINTHLDPYDPAVRALQGQELIDGPVATEMPVVLLGDLNAEVSMPTMEALLGAGFSDGWASAGEQPGQTCCFGQDLADPESILDQRIDFVLVSDGLEVIGAERIGADQAARIGDLWPSDHAGVVADVVFQAAVAEGA